MVAFLLTHAWGTVDIQIERLPIQTEQSLTFLQLFNLFLNRLVRYVELLKILLRAGPQSPICLLAINLEQSCPLHDARIVLHSAGTILLQPDRNLEVCLLSRVEALSFESVADVIGVDILVRAKHHRLELQRGKYDCEVKDQE